MSLNPEQHAAVTHVDGPLLVLAGAGSGKTRVITQRVAYLLDQGIEPEHIMAVSFTNKAAVEMRERVAKLVGTRLASRTQLSTFHSLGVELLRRYIDRLGYSVPFTILDPGDQLRLLKSVFEDEGIPAEIDPKDVLAVISRAKNCYCQPKSLRSMRLNPLVPYAQRVFLPYVQASQGQNAVDFDDLITLPVKLFSQHPDVLAICRDQYRYVMVDEYQDTNDTQLFLLKILCAPKNNICVVGDDDQSIYAFRGAVTEHILNFERHFPGAQVVKLEQNYRSTTTILEAANAVIGNNKQRRSKALWSALGEGEKIRFFNFDDEYGEAEAVANEILRNHRQGSPLSDFAVLFRTAVLSRPLEEALTELNIPFRLVGGTKFFDRREIKDLTAYLKLCLNPRDNMSVLRVINTPTRGIGNTTIAKLADHGRTHKLPLMRVLRDAGKIAGLGAGQASGMADLADLVDEYKRRFASEPLAATLEALIERLHYRNYLKGAEKSEKVVRIRIDNVDAMIRSLAAFQHHGGDLAGYVARLSIDALDNEREEETGVATLMTLHGSKGLEFPQVFLLGFEEDILPHRRSLEPGDDGGLEEERRLLYVGITRAQQKLWLTAAKKRGRGHAADRVVSRFYHELPEELLSTEEIFEDPEEERERVMRQIEHFKRMELDS